MQKCLTYPRASPCSLWTWRRGSRAELGLKASRYECQSTVFLVWWLLPLLLANCVIPPWGVRLGRCSMQGNSSMTTIPCPYAQATPSTKPHPKCFSTGVLQRAQLYCHLVTKHVRSASERWWGQDFRTPIVLPSGFSIESQQRERGPHPYPHPHPYPIPIPSMQYASLQLLLSLLCFRGSD